MENVQVEVGQDVEELITTLRRENDFLSSTENLLESKCASLDSKVEKFENEIILLKKELETRPSLQEFESAVRIQMLATGEAHEQNEKLKAEICKLEQENRGLSEQVNVLLKKLSTRESEMEKVKTQLLSETENLKTKLLRSSQQAQITTEKCDMLSTLLREMKEDRRQIVAQKLELDIQLGVEKQEKLNYVKHVQQLELSLEETRLVQEKNQRLQEKLAQEELGGATLRKQMENLEKKFAEATESLKEQQQENEVLRQSLEECSRLSCNQVDRPFPPEQDEFSIYIEQQSIEMQKRMLRLKQS